jgi:hypothetical protein
MSVSGLFAAAAAAAAAGLLLAPILHLLCFFAI